MIDISICPQKYAILIFRFIIDELSYIEITINILKSIPILAVILKITLIKSQLVTFID
jgi:hypothetical protein